MAIKIKGWHIAVIAIAILLLWYAGYIKFSTQPIQQQPQPSENLVSVNKPLQFAVVDPLAGGGLVSAGVTVYGTDKTLKESLTTATDGYTAQTALPYSSDTSLHVKVSKAGYVTRWFSVVVPKMTPSDAQSLTTNYIPLQTVNLGTYTIKVTDQFGTSYTSGSTKLNFTALTVSTCSVTISIYNTEDNSGYISSYDPLNNINLNVPLLTSTTDSKATVTGAGSSVARGTNTYWISVVSDDGLTRQLVGNEYVKPGVTSVTITFGKGSLAAGETQNFVFTLYDYFDQSYFAANGIGGPYATSLASFTLILAA